MSEVAPTREIPTEPQGKAELKIAIGAECGLDLRQRIATTGSAPANVMFRQDTLVRIAIRLPNSRGDARNPRNLTCPELREWIAKAVGEEPPDGQFRWVHLKRIYETLQERELRADGGTEQTGSDQDYSDATVYSRAGFDAPEPELENEPVICAGCGDASSADEMGVHMDETVSSESGAVVQVKRRYVHNEEQCLAAVLGIEVADEAGDLDD